MTAAFALAGVLTLGVVRPLMGDVLRTRAFVLRIAPLFGVAPLRASIAIAERVS